ncbi:MAG: hypothetical protein ACXWCF_02200 [Kaistella sp.]
MSKIQLSSAEKELMKNADVILTKNTVLKKIRIMLEQVQQMQMEFIIEHELSITDPFLISPKISKGENYEGLPYIILDFPRMTLNHHFFLARTMFWWGHHFSSTLHLSGNYKTQYKEKIKISYSQLSEFFICINTDQWQHHFKESNYIRIDTLSEKQFAEHCNAFEHLKIAFKCSLDNWNEDPVGLFTNWKLLIQLCGLIS